MRVRSLPSMLACMLVFFATADISSAAEVFPLSTEIQIGKIKNLVDRAPVGIYLTVGGERAFRSASLFQDIEHLIICDVSPVVIRFNKINIELLKAPDRATYKHLRWESDFAAWKKCSAVLTEDDFQWWKEHVREAKGYDLPERLNRTGQAHPYILVRQKLRAIYPKVARKFNNRESTFLHEVTWEDIENNQKGLKNPLTKAEFDWFTTEKAHPDSCVRKFIDDPRLAVDWGQVVDYKSGNYLFDEDLYQRLKRLALDHKITVVEADLSTPQKMETIAQLIRKLGSKLAVLDLNNLYLYQYMGEEKMRSLLTKLLPLGEKDSILILMNNYKDYPCAQFSIYVGFTFEHVKSWPKEPFFDAFVNGIPAEVQALMDGRLYEGQDELPLYLAEGQSSGQ